MMLVLKVSVLKMIIKGELQCSVEISSFISELRTDLVSVVHLRMEKGSKMLATSILSEISTQFLGLVSAKVVTAVIGTIFEPNYLLQGESRIQRTSMSLVQERHRQFS
jgi:hypothetical protein